MINCWIAGILLFNFELVHVPGRDHVGPDGLSRWRPTVEDEGEPQDNWIDEVLDLGVWVNSWVEAQELEEARSTLPIFQQSAGCPTGGAAPMPVKTLGEGIADEELGNGSSPPLLAFSFPFFSFSLCSAANSMAGIDIPRSEADAQADLELPRIQGSTQPASRMTWTKPHSRSFSNEQAGFLCAMANFGVGVPLSFTSLSSSVPGTQLSYFAGT